MSDDTTGLAFEVPTEEDLNKTIEHAAWANVTDTLILTAYLSSNETPESIELNARIIRPEIAETILKEIFENHDKLISNEAYRNAHRGCSIEMQEIIQCIRESQIFGRENAQLTKGLIPAYMINVLVSLNPVNIIKLAKDISAVRHGYIDEQSELYSSQIQFAQLAANTLLNVQHDWRAKIANDHTTLAYDLERMVRLPKLLATNIRGITLRNGQVIDREQAERLFDEFINNLAIKSHIPEYTIALRSLLHEFHCNLEQIRSGFKLNDATTARIIELNNKIESGEPTQADIDELAGLIEDEEKAITYALLATSVPVISKTKISIKSAQSVSV